MKSIWREKLDGFRDWAATCDQDEIEWETYYGEENWKRIYQVVGEFLSVSVPSQWTPDEVEDLFYLLAHDGEVWSEMALLLRRQFSAALQLAILALSVSKVESVARRELADILGYLPMEPQMKLQVEGLLERFADDEEEQVLRFALRSLARIGSAQTEALALREWHREHSNQQWARMMALTCWHHVGSPLLEAHLQEAEASPFAYLSYFAQSMRNGGVPPL